MWVKFTALHWHRFNANAKSRYLPGMVKNVPTDVAEGAIAAGHAVKLKKTSKSAQPVEVPDEAPKRRRSRA